MRQLLLLALVTTGCLRKTEFKCQTSDQCSTGGVCESTGYCSFADTDCSGGRRYGELSGDLGGQCVGGNMPGIDGGVDAMSDAPPAGCPATYMTLAGAGTHKYRVITAIASWATQKAACAADGANAYMTVPNDQAELTALVTAANVARMWVGIDDQTNPGTYVTTQGGTFSASDPLWATGQPDHAPFNGGGASNCVAGVKSSAQLADTKCSEQYPTLCECEP